MADIDTVLALGEEFTFKGKTYTVSPADYLVMGQFVKWLKSIGLHDILQSAGSVNDYIIREMLSVHQQNCVAGVYHFDGDVSVRCRDTLDGRKRMAVLQLHRGSPEIGLAEATHLIEEIYDSGDEAILAIETAMQKANADPNRAKPYRPTPTTGSKTAG